jgi:predicted AAA+ superfamily ATPase
LQRIFKDIAYRSLDRPAVAQAASESPDRFLDEVGTPVVLDEVQYAPGLFREIKPRVDQHRSEYGRYILTGSQRFELMAGISESLAGRIRVLELGTLSAAELRAADIDIADYRWRGGYPELWANPKLETGAFFEDYTAAYLERDLNQFLHVSSLRDFRRFMLACAVRTGQLLNYSDLARDVGVTAKTIKIWVDALNAGGLIHVLPPYYANIGKRLTKAPKLYFADHGLLCHLLNIRSTAVWNEHPQRGALWENLVLCEYLKVRNLRPGHNFFFYRDQNAVEIDFVIDEGSTLELIEAKSAERPDPRRLNFAKVAPLFPGRKIRATLACDTREPDPLTMRNYRLLNPLLHAP